MSLPTRLRTLARILHEVLSSMPQATLPLIERLGDPEDGVGLLAAQALGDIGEPAIGPLLDALSDPRPTVRKNAAVAFIHLGPAARRAAPQLKPLLGDRSKAVRRAAAQALRRILGRK